MYLGPIRCPEPSYECHVHLRLLGQRSPTSAAPGTGRTGNGLCSPAEARSAAAGAGPHVSSTGEGDPAQPWARGAPAWLLGAVPGARGPEQGSGTRGLPGSRSRAGPCSRRHTGCGSSRWATGRGSAWSTAGRRGSWSLEGAEAAREPGGRQVPHPRTSRSRGDGRCPPGTSRSTCAWWGCEPEETLVTPRLPRVPPTQAPPG